LLVGAVRATTSCLNCHEVEEGGLLGAFTYPLVSWTVADKPSTAPAVLSEKLLKDLEQLGKERRIELVTYDSLHDPTAIALPSPASTEENLRILQELPSLTSVKIYCAANPISADAMLSLAKLPKLRELIIRGAYPKITDDVGMTLRFLSANLEVLEVRYAVIDRAALESLAALPKLRSLRISAQPGFGDAEVALLQHLSVLEELYLSGTNVTDASLPYFAAIPRLKKLVLNRTKVTPAGLSSSKLLSRVHVDGVKEP